MSGSAAHTQHDNVSGLRCRRAHSGRDCPLPAAIGTQRPHLSTLGAKILSMRSRQIRPTTLRAPIILKCRRRLASTGGHPMRSTDCG
eukprot:7450071-Alexandrium_andersonii.AAC.1